MIERNMHHPPPLYRSQPQDLAQSYPTPNSNILTLLPQSHLSHISQPYQSIPSVSHYAKSVSCVLKPSYIPQHDLTLPRHHHNDDSRTGRAHTLKFIRRTWMQRIYNTLFMSLSCSTLRRTSHVEKFNDKPATEDIAETVQKS